MPTIKYFDEDPVTVAAGDVMPIVLMILTTLEEDCVKWSMKVAVDFEYPDLKEWIDHDQLYAEDFELLDECSDKRVRIIVPYIVFFEETMRDYLNLFPFNMEEIFLDERLLHLARDFYGALMYEEEGEDDENYFNRLLTFMECILQILYCMCELVINGSVDIEAVYEYNGSCYKLHDGDWDSYIDAEEHEFSLLAKLMKETLNCQNELYESFP